MDDSQLLDLCLKVTGAFEDGTPQYDALTGSGDGEGLSAGILQWNVGQGTLQKLVTSIAAKSSWTTVQSFFKSDIQSFASMSPSDALAFVKTHYLATNSTQLSPAAVTAWKGLLSTQASIDAQREMATNTTLAHAHKDATLFVPEYPENPRVIAFFFDLINQQGSMASVKPTPVSSPIAALTLAQSDDPKCAALWSSVVETDPLAARLLYYAYERASLARTQYVWDSLSRRGTIACRVGIVHATHVNLTQLLP